MSTGFSEKLLASIERNNSLLCVGLDPEPAYLPAMEGERSIEEALVAWGERIITATSDLVCCYKPNSAFYEQFGPPGLNALRRTCRAVPDPVPVLLDVKRGDIGSTAVAYARSAFEVFGADAVTLSPYLGRDSVAPFLAYPGKAAFVLCQTSNPSAGEVQNYGPDPLYMHVVHLAQGWGDATQIGFVIGATQPAALSRVRQAAPDRWFLAPGVGAQGANLEAALAAGLNARGGGVIVPVSRGVLAAPDPRGAALRLRDEINSARTHAAAAAPIGAGAAASLDRARDLAVQLYDAGCVQFGEFTLASGKKSPIYIDLRRMVSYPELLGSAAQMLEEAAAGISYDLLAAVPYAALPVTALLSGRTGKPMIYPRKEVKAHGTGKAVEGKVEPGKTALVVEDVITTGGSILEAIATLEAGGVIVNDVAVLVDRDQGGRNALRERGYGLSAVLEIGRLLDALLQAQRIDGATHASVAAYLTGS
jgi:uridine monophosphate synthetase